MTHILTKALKRFAKAGTPLNGADLRAWRALQPGEFTNGKRQKRGWPQSQAASHLGLSESGYQKMEAGTRPVAPYVIRLLLADVRVCPHCGKTP